jgi:hypothetical protein
VPALGTGTHKRLSQQRAHDTSSVKLSMTTTATVFGAHENKSACFLHSVLLALVLHTTPAYLLSRSMPVSCRKKHFKQGENTITHEEHKRNHRTNYLICTHSGNLADIDKKFPFVNSLRFSENIEQGRALVGSVCRCCR